MRQWTKFGNAELKEVETDKCGKQEPVFAVKDWTRFNPE